MMMICKATCIAAISALLTLSGCIGQDEVLFVTNTNVGLNLDSKPPTAGIAYDREEGYIGPAYSNGTFAPVVARLESNLSVFSPEVHQVYATGDAAKLLVTQNPDAPDYRQLRHNSKRVAYFVTESSTGLRVTFASQLPDSLHFGYRRKEFSFLPIGTSTTGKCTEPTPQDPTTAKSDVPAVDCYGSVLATIDIGANVGADAQHTNMEVAQLFATGYAAEMLAAKDDDTRKLFKAKLGITESITSGGSCDTDCEKIEAYIKKNGDDGARTVLTKCVRPAGLHIIEYLLRSPEARVKAARQSCASSLPA